MVLARSARTSVTLLILGTVAIWLAFIVGGAARGIIRPDPFARRLAGALSDSRVSRYVAARITDAIIEQRPNLVSVRSILEPSVSTVVSSEPFRAVVRTSARAAHRSLFESGRNVVLSLPDIAVLVRSALARANPELASKIPPSIEATLASPQAEQAFTRFIKAWGLVARVLWGAWIVLILGFVAFVAAIWVAPDRENALVRTGAAFGAIALALIAVLPAGRLLAAGITPDPELRGVVHGVWVAYFAPVKMGAVIAACIGVVMVSAGSTMLEALDPLMRIKAFGRWVTEPLRPRGRIVRAILLLAAGGYAIVNPMRTADVLVALTGLLLVYMGLREVFRLVLVRAQGLASASAIAQPDARAWRVLAVVAAVLVLALGGTALLVFRAPAAPLEAAGVATVCNGSARLCNRRLDQVVFAGAHNAMSNAEVPGWLFPHQNHLISRQLEDGVRALLIDVHYGVPAGDHVITDFDREGTGSSRKKIEGALGPEATDAALRIRARWLGHETGPSAIYFCHGFCELGAYPVEPTLAGVREFMVANPGEVVILVIEDYIGPEDIAQLLKDAGLVDLIYTGSLTRPVPTLRQLIDWGQRLVVFIESGKPGVPWLRSAWEAMQETPYTFHTPADFSCGPNRGPATAPFFQINNWIETTPAPRPSNAEIVNAYSALLARARSCREQRGRLPNILAVDFYDVGDLFRVVRTLNGLDQVARPRAAQ
jgi:hypothetical protein